MPTGKVKWFDPKKGYGFIVGDEGQDVFVHYTSIDGNGFRALRDGETVEYEAAKGDKGYQASRVTRKSGPGSPSQSYNLRTPPPAAPSADGEIAP